MKFHAVPLGGGATDRHSQSQYAVPELQCGVRCHTVMDTDINYVFRPHPADIYHDTISISIALRLQSSEPTQTTCCYSRNHRIRSNMAWQPQPAQLAQLAQFLRDSLSGHDATAQKNAERVSFQKPLNTVVVKIRGRADLLLDAQTSQRVS